MKADGRAARASTPVTLYRDVLLEASQRLGKFHRRQVDAVSSQLRQLAKDQLIDATVGIAGLSDAASTANGGSVRAVPNGRPLNLGGVLALTASSHRQPLLFDGKLSSDSWPLLQELGGSKPRHHAMRHQEHLTNSKSPGPPACHSQLPGMHYLRGLAEIRMGVLGEASSTWRSSAQPTDRLFRVSLMGRLALQ